jgi:glutaredoxin
MDPEQPKGDLPGQQHFDFEGVLVRPGKQADKPVVRVTVRHQTPGYKIEPPLRKNMDPDQLKRAEELAKRQECLSPDVLQPLPPGPKPSEILFSLVKERPDPSLHWDRPSCPYCNAAKTHLESRGHCETLLGGIGDHDPNHHWYYYRCKACERTFVLERKNDNVWYTGSFEETVYKGQDGKEISIAEHGHCPEILKGIPTCFESYAYHCAHCGGRVTRHYTAKDGYTKCTCLSSRFVDGKHIRDYRIFFACDSCARQVEMEWDHWGPHMDEPLKPYVPSKPIEFKAFESAGAVFGNADALRKAKFE